MIKSFIRNSLLLGTCLCSSLSAKEDGPSLPEYYEDFPKSVENLIVIHDPMNWMIKVLDNPKVKGPFQERKPSQKF